MFASGGNGAEEALLLSCLAVSFSALAVFIVVWTAGWRTKGGRSLHRRTREKLGYASSRVRFIVQALENYVANSGTFLGDPESDERFMQLSSELKESRQEKISLEEELDRIKAQYPGVEVIEWLSSPCRALGEWKSRRRTQGRRDELGHVKALAGAIEDLINEEESADVLWRQAYIELDSRGVWDPIEYDDISVHLPEKWGQMKVSQGNFNVSGGLVLRPFRKEGEG